MNTFKKTLGTMGVVLLMIAGLISCGGGIKEIRRTSITDGKIHIASMESDTHGVAVGYAGTVQYTENGGQTWSAGSNRSMCMYGLDVLDAKICIAAGNKSQVIKTKDGGKHWERLTDIPKGRAKGVSFAGENEGWIWTKSDLFQTRNGGESWESVQLPTKSTIIESAFLLPKGNGFICTLDGFVCRTRDNGSTWEQIVSYRDPKDKTFTANIAGSVQGTAIRFSGDWGIVAVIGLQEVKPIIRIIQTKDGGATWSEQVSYDLEIASKTLSITPDMSISIFNNDSSVSKFIVK